MRRADCTDTSWWLGGGDFHAVGPLGTGKHFQRAEGETELLFTSLRNRVLFSPMGPPCIGLCGTQSDEGGSIKTWWLCVMELCYVYIAYMLRSTWIFIKVFLFQLSFLRTSWFCYSIHILCTIFYSKADGDSIERVETRKFRTAIEELGKIEMCFKLWGH